MVLAHPIAFKTCNLNQVSTPIVHVSVDSLRLWIARHSLPWSEAFHAW
jgi:hypothetical protein